MIERVLILTGGDAELLSQALEEVKTKYYEESETSLDEAQALKALISSYGAAEKRGERKETFRADVNPLTKHLVLGTVIALGGAKNI